MQCEHIHGDGARCLTPAMHRRSFCYMHWRQREHKLAVSPEQEFQLPTIDSEASVVLASNQIAHAVLAGKLDTRKARVVLACLKIAIDSLRRQQDVSGVSELELTPAMHKELVGTGTNTLGTGINVETETNHVGTDVLVRSSGATAPRSLAASQEPHPPSPTHPMENETVSALSSGAERSGARDLLFAHTDTEADLERFIDQHPLTNLKAPTLAEIAGSV